MALLDGGEPIGAVEALGSRIPGAVALLKEERVLAENEIFVRALGGKDRLQTFGGSLCTRVREKRFC